MKELISKGKNMELVILNGQMALTIMENLKIIT